MVWDEEAEPSIQTPLSDFFGAIGGKTIDYQSVPMQINHACYMCYLPMPFAKRARFQVANDGDALYSKSVAYGIDYEQGASFAQEKSRLHCAWRRRNPVKDGLHTILEARGEVITWGISCKSTRGFSGGGAKGTRSSTWTASR